MGLVLSTKNLILKELLLMTTTKHEGLRAAYINYRNFYYSDKNRAESRKELIKKNCKFRRLNKLLDLGAKL